MANTNFVVHNGLTVGSLTVDATSGNVTTSGNLILTGSAVIYQPGGAVGATTADATALAIALGG